MALQMVVQQGATPLSWMGIIPRPRVDCVRHASGADARYTGHRGDFRFFIAGRAQGEAT